MGRVAALGAASRCARCNNSIWRCAEDVRLRPARLAGRPGWPADDHQCRVRDSARPRSHSFFPSNLSNPIFLASTVSHCTFPLSFRSFIRSSFRPFLPPTTPPPSVPLSVLPSLAPSLPPSMVPSLPPFLPGSSVSSNFDIFFKPLHHPFSIAVSSVIQECRKTHFIFCTLLLKVE